MSEDEATELTILESLIAEAVVETSWEVFKSKDTIEKSIEIKALLVNARKRCDKLLEVHRNGLCQQATTNEADAQQVGSEAEGE